MTRSPLTVLAALLAGTLCAAGAPAQERPAQGAPRNLALEIVGQNYGPSPVLEPPSEGGFMETVPPRQLPNWKQRAGAVPLTRIRIRSKYEGEGVRINVAGVFDDSEPADAPGPKYGPREEAIGSYLAQEGETVTVGELKRFGFEPLLLRVVKDDRQRAAAPPALQPLLVNPLKSVTVVSLDTDPGASTSYRLTLRNLTAKSIIALDVYSAQERGRSSVRAQGTPERPLMLPGATYVTHAGVNTGGGRMTPQGFIPDPPRQPTLTVGTVIFDDGTYEGEVQAAAEYTAQARGWRMQLARVAALLQNVIDAPAEDASASLEKLKTQISTLRIDVDAALVDELLALFPELPKENSRTWLASEIMSGFRHGREDALYRLKDMETARARDPARFDFQRYLLALKEQLEPRAGAR